MRSLLQSEAQLIELVSGVRMRLKPNFSCVYAEKPGGDSGVTKDRPDESFSSCSVAGEMRRESPSLPNWMITRIYCESGSQSEIITGYCRSKSAFSARVRLKIENKSALDVSDC